MARNLLFPARLALLTTITATLLAIPLRAGAQLIISEFRTFGSGGVNDEYIVITNPNATQHTVAALSGTGYGVAASDGVTRFSIPNGTIIPGYGSYLGVNNTASIGYSLGAYATGNATWTTDIPTNAGIAIFNNNTGGGSYTLANRMDAVGSTSEVNTLYKEGTGYPALTFFAINQAFYRDRCGKSGSITTFGNCTAPGVFKDTGNNAADFVFVDTNGTSAGGGQRLGAPGPRNLASPRMGGSITTAPMDGCTNDFAPPNFVRDFTSVPAQNSTFGTVDFRRRFTNNTGGSITKLRFRVVDQSTFPAPSGVADLRLRTSTDVVVAGVDRPPCGVGFTSPTVFGTTLEEPPLSPNGTAFGGSVTTGTITPGTPLANGASIDLRFLFGIQQPGSYKVALVIEASPAGGNPAQTVYLEGCIDSGCVMPSNPVTDFTGDLKSDILYRNFSTGQVYRLLMNGFAATGAALAYTEPNLAWKVVADADFTGDGVADLLWRNTSTGEVYLMPFTSEGMPGPGAVVYNEPNAAWKIAHTPDIDGDGIADILWWNSSTGQVFATLMNGFSIKAAGFVYTEPNTLWKIMAVGDMANGGKDNNLIWWNSSTGQVYRMVVTVAGSVFSVTGSFIYTEPNTAWKPIAAPDLNGDGKSDLLWRNDATGQIYGLLMNANIISTQGMIYTEPNLSWKIVAQGDYNGDGKSDLLWRNDSTGQLFMQLMNGLSPSVSALIYTEPNTAWHVLGPWEYVP